MSRTIITRKTRLAADRAGRNAIGGYTGYLKDLPKDDRAEYEYVHAAVMRELTQGQTYYTAACFPAY
jgi:hypothetical protein